MRVLLFRVVFVMCVVACACVYVLWVFACCVFCVRDCVFVCVCVCVCVRFACVFLRVCVCVCVMLC